MTLIEILARYMTPFEVRLCIAEMARFGLIPAQVKVIDGEFTVMENGENETTN